VNDESLPDGLGRGSLTAVVDVVGAVAEQPATPAQVARAWLRYRSEAMLVAAALGRAARVEENLGSLTVDLAPEQLDALDAAGAAVSDNRFEDLSRLSAGRE
jgi:aryl-alcohol dehydrogenase-like predicted oxidoreductase